MVDTVSVSKQKAHGPKAVFTASNMHNPEEIKKEKINRYPVLSQWLITAVQVEFVSLTNTISQKNIHGNLGICG